MMAAYRGFDAQRAETAANFERESRQRERNWPWVLVLVAEILAFALILYFQSGR